MAIGSDLELNADAEAVDLSMQYEKSLLAMLEAAARDYFAFPESPRFREEMAGHLERLDQVRSVWPWYSERFKAKYPRDCIAVRMYQ
ncbi:MAG: hypothetical protein WC969_15340 [Elusimicrobiota bacterium]|jgi:hypothetical protein